MLTHSGCGEVSTPQFGAVFPSTGHTLACRPPPTSSIWPLHRSWTPPTPSHLDVPVHPVPIGLLGALGPATLGLDAALAPGTATRGEACGSVAGGGGVQDRRCRQVEQATAAGVALPSPLKAPRRDNPMPCSRVTPPAVLRVEQRDLHALVGANLQARRLHDVAQVLRLLPHLTCGRGAACDGNRHSVRQGTGARAACGLLPAALQPILPWGQGGWPRSTCNCERKGANVSIEQAA